MKIGIDARALTGRYTGDRTYWRNLIRAFSRLDSDNVYVLYSREPLPEEDLPQNGRFVSRVLECSSDRRFTLTTLPAAANKDKVDLLHVQYTVPPRYACQFAVVSTIHDISFRLHPEWFPAKDRILLNLTVPMAMRNSDALITDSESSLVDIRRTYGSLAKEMVAIPLGLTEGFAGIKLAEIETVKAEARQVISEKYGINVPFILSIGVLQPRKNLRTLAEAFGALKMRYNVAHRLVLVGKAGWMMERDVICGLANRGSQSGAESSVIFPGYVPDSELQNWYRACDLFAHPALYEGFGIPPLEAMACGAVTVVSDAPALPEVVADSALVCPATSVDAWVETLHAAISNQELRARLSESGPRRAAQFDWTRAAESTIQVYNKAVRAYLTRSRR